ncbi:MAG TPA: ATP synthase F1 subunit delta [Pyrinomonadaceae bacterium]|nr:ATP synthase F1 subunit delta [Pyrinomonadaceae bacterium]
MSSQTVARRYAAALADVTLARKEADEVQAELKAWEDMMLTNASLLEAFSNPTVAYDQKGKLLNELISRTKVRPTTANFLRILLKNQRLAELPAVNAKLAQVLDERAGVISAQVTSARPVPEATRASLAEKLGKLTGRKVRLTFGTDESLLGGIVTRIDSTIYDGSVRDQLRRLGEELAG